MTEDSKIIRSVANLLDCLRENVDLSTPVWFRGHIDDKWKLLPSLARRKKWISSEEAMLSRFKQDAHPRLQGRPESEWDWLFLAQHHGVPTRLLDWTENPLVGLYFAVEQDGPEGELATDGALWSLNPMRLNELTKEQSPCGISLFGHDERLDDYLPGKQKDTPSMGPLAAIATRSFGRIVAQSGTFTISHKSFKPLEEVYDGECVSSFIVPIQAKESIRSQLEWFGVTAMSVYPDLSHLGNYVKGLF